ncbi:hypothetical protein RUM44_004768 [Polyplax serrata]|uniref:AAA+ ATPase domain-containing protein n=1 Tax=Polyplax serrata TaxID=468196 RepID=A0ABR1B3V2_POLSC
MPTEIEKDCRMEKGEKVKKLKRKIKIRLLDANNPNSYICEVFDSSLENEDSNFGDSNDVSPKVSDAPNLKSYFEILMSNECRKNLKNESMKENNIYKRSKLNDSNNSEKIEKKKIRSKSKPQITLAVGKELENCETNSSDEESLFQVQQKYSIKNSLRKANLENCTESETQVVTINEELVFEPKVKFSAPPNLISPKKTFNILNYFTKNEDSLKTQIEKVEKLEGIIRGSRTFNSPNHCPKEPKDATGNTLKESNQKEQEKKIIPLQTKNIKIAPLFQLKEKKIKDLAIKKARYDFLHREVPLLKSSNSNTVVDLVLDFQPTCHVQQRDDSIYWSLRQMSSPASESTQMQDILELCRRQFRTYVTCNREIINTFHNCDEVVNCNQAVEFNNKILGEMKLQYKNLNFDTVIDGLKLKRDNYMKLKKELTSSRRGKKPQKDESNVELLNSQWTERYKLSTSDMLGNEKVVRKLRSWLQSWKNFDEEIKNAAKMSKPVKKAESDEDSEDDYFVKSDDERQELKAPISVCLLTGPNGCGKTALVSSLAEELEFNVLEVNASSKRTGKKVLTDFQEATQSHKVQHVSAPQLQEFFKPVKKKKAKKQKVKNLQVREETNDRKISLLLIEDADIVFEEHDEGFYAAIASLVQTSKRPFVFITDNFECEQLDTFKTEDTLILRMEHPPFLKSCAFLEIVSRLEGSPIEKETAEFLVLRNQMDLRKSLLELQFWSSPSIEVLKSREPFDLARFWWSLTKFLYPRDAERPIKTVNVKRKRQDTENESADEGEIVSKKVKVGPENGQHEIVPVVDTSSSKVDGVLRSFSDVLDIASVLDVLGCSCTDEPIPGLDYKPKSSLCLEENRDEVFCMQQAFREEICGELVKMATKYFSSSRKGQQTDKEALGFSCPSWEDIRWRNSQEEARDQLCTLVSSATGRDRRSVHLDYLPIIRSICRLERNRSMSNSKRKNRFCHYFNGTELELSQNTLDISCQVFTR